MALRTPSSRGHDLLAGVVGSGAGLVTPARKSVVDSSPVQPGLVTAPVSTSMQPQPPSASRPRSGRSAVARRPPAPAQPPAPAGNPATSSVFPLPPAAALKLYGELLTEYEQSEIFDHPSVFFLAPDCQKIRATLSNPKNNHGYDDDRGDYVFVPNDHLAYRYELTSIMGKGSFGQVFKAFDHKTQSGVAVKVIRNKRRFHHQAQVEVRLLAHLRDHDPDDASHVIRMNEYFYFRNHLCISFELLSINLYEFIKNNNFQGLSLNLIRKFAYQILISLRYIYQERLIHCDLKPENILLKSPTKSAIKVIDFGSSCFENERVYTYIQSRFYRAPEIILGISYGKPIDMWSFGCIMCELFTGYPVFPGENEVEQLACIMEVLDIAPRHMLEAASRRKQFFDSQLQPRLVPNSRGKVRRPGAKDLNSVLRCADPVFVNFVEGCLRWDPRDRFTPDDALRHPWIHEVFLAYQQPLRPPSSDRSRRRHRGDGQAVVLNGQPLSFLQPRHPGGSSTSGPVGPLGSLFAPRPPPGPPQNPVREQATQASNRPAVTQTQPAPQPPVSSQPPQSQPPQLPQAVDPTVAPTTAAVVPLRFPQNEEMPPPNTGVIPSPHLITEMLPGSGDPVSDAKSSLLPPILEKPKASAAPAPLNTNEVVAAGTTGAPYRVRATGGSIAPL